VAPVDDELPGGAPSPAVVYTDALGHQTDEPAGAVSAEITEYDGHGRPRRLTRFFFLNEKELPWLPVSEGAFLLWVLVALIVGWLLVGLILGLI
jgi:hypothetical protein